MILMKETEPRAYDLQCLKMPIKNRLPVAMSHVSHVILLICYHSTQKSKLVIIMARKRVRVESGESKRFDGGGSSRSRINTYNDVAASDDEFADDQDKVLLTNEKSIRNEGDDDVQASDEEVLSLGGESSDESDFEDSDDSAESGGFESGDDAASESFELGGWGSSKSEYYNDSTGGERLDMKAEEQEALMIQQRNLARLDSSAYMDDLTSWKDTRFESGNGVVVEGLPTVMSKNLPRDDLLKILRTRHPEFALFAQEFAKLHQLLPRLTLLSALHLHPQYKIIHAQHCALRAYLGVLAFYFVLMSDEKQEADDIKEHELMVSIIRCRDLWSKLSVVSIKDESGTVATLLPELSRRAMPQIKKKKSRETSRTASAVPQSAKTVESFAPGMDSKLDQSIEALKTLPKKRKNARSGLSDYADNTADSIDAEESAARRKTLQFYASQIHTKRAVRNAAAQSGDMDLPYRERRKERDMRLQSEAEKRKGGSIGDTLDNSPVPAREDLSADENEYYQLVAAAASSKKIRTKEEHDESVANLRAERAGYINPVNEVGKRKISRQIATNKGLTANRPKENRNPRVKKKLRYEQAKKKLNSQKAIFKGQGGQYLGELSGIKGNVIKSTKFK